MTKEVYIFKDGKVVKATKWILLKRKIYSWITRFKIIDTWKYDITNYNDRKYYFKLNPSEYEQAKKIYKEKGTISYEFYPCGGISFGIRVRVLKTGEVIEISDVSSWQ